MIRPILAFTTVFCLCITSSAQDDTYKNFVEIPPRTLPGYRLNQTNSILMEQSFRRMFRKTQNFEKVEVKLYCYKKWKIPGRTDGKTYQCEPRAFKVIKED